MKKTTLTPETIARYRRAAVLPSAAEQVERLNTLSLHHEILDLVLGERALAVGAEKVWLATALRLGATPAQDARAAHLKINYLQACMSAWIAPNAKRGNHHLSAALIAGATAAEEHRWGYPAEGANPN